MRGYILPNGDLEIRIGEEEQAELRENRANAADPDSDVNWESDETMRAILEPLVTNDDYLWCEPHWTGALTDAPMLAICGEEEPLPLTVDPDFHRVVGAWENGEGKRRIWYTPIEKLWYYEPYQVRAPQDDLADTGRCIFTKAPDAEE